MTSGVASIKPNPYIFNIENRKRRKPRLAHEIGEGAKCKKCEDKCAGFQLHFWRKICVNCRCGKDDHDVEDDDEDIGQILIGKLFERPIRTPEEEELYSYGTNLDMTNEATGKTENVAFDWVPPGIAKELAKKYMEQLPAEKRPIAGSEAAKKRKRQLEQQLPLYDVDENERCENMAPQEYQNFQKYLKVLRTKVAGQAKIQEIVALVPKQHSSILRNLNEVEDLPSPPLPPPPPLSFEYLPSDATSSLPSPPIPPPPTSFNFAKPAEIKFATLSAFEALENTLNNNASRSQWPKKQSHNEKASLGSDKLPYKRNQHALSNEVIQDAANAMGELSLRNKNGYPLPAEAAHVPTEEANLPTQSAAFPPCFNSGFGSTITNNRTYPNEATPSFELQRNLNSFQPVKLKMNDRSVQTIPYSNASNMSSSTLAPIAERPSGAMSAGAPFTSHVPISSGDASLSKNSKGVGTHDEIPSQSQITEKLLTNPIMTSQDVSKAPLPSLVARESLVPFVDANQAPYAAQRDKIRGRGAEVQSGDVNILFPSESQTLGSSRFTVPQNDVDTASQFACQYCEKLLLAGDVAVICERAGPDKYWHPSCFVCGTCKELLADLIYFFKDGQVYCGRHYNEAASMPRCHACDELIFGETWTRADGFDWHINHFCCFVCDEPLGGSKYVPDQKGFPHCLSCYMTFLAKMCEFCEEKITPDQPRTGYRGYFYHAQPDCFCCFKCRKSLMGHRFKMAKNWVFCSQECINLCTQEIASNPNPKDKSNDEA